MLTEYRPCILIGQIFGHPDYNTKTYENDIALLEVSQDIPFPADNSIAPVCLPEVPIDDSAQVGAIASGWGLTSIRK